MPPNHIRSTGALRMAVRISTGDALVFDRPIASAAARESAIDFCERETMMPPSESLFRS